MKPTAPELINIHVSDDVTNIHKVSFEGVVTGGSLTAVLSLGSLTGVLSLGSLTTVIAIAIIPFGNTIFRAWSSSIASFTLVIFNCLAMFSSSIDGTLMIN